MRRLVFICALAGVMMALPALSEGSAQEPQMGDVWSDPGSGFAIGGYDPVAYFVRRAPRRGKAGVELAIDGVVWKFLNEANKEVFARDPAVYAPRFAGRDPMQLARGFESLGNPHNWLIQNEALYLFTTSLSRSAWMAAPASERRKAAVNWTSVVKATQ